MNIDTDRDDPFTVKNIQAIRRAGERALVVARWDPDRPRAAVPQKAEVLIPLSQIDKSSQVKEPGDVGTLVIPTWLAIDRGFTV